ncbi:hypothetical protein Q8G43_08750 [Acinetobacter schindleri]|uniref:hypothetical protein n=1 Tax=Acinetobacter schindleri TaxID=108981 RepID=UPI0027312EE5|nr:hypothetical protein [Acinetobacter schindleri]MDP1445051.1 hypothetical protein [Acinetobacter schindleri]
MSIAKQEVINLYSEVKASVNHAINDISAISLSNNEEQQHILNIRKRLSDISENFNQEINSLETNSEWEKFTIAFFGETNAGKSTIIESLRIIFNEKERQNLIENGEAELEDLERSFSQGSDALIADLNEKLKDFTNEIRNIENQISEIKSKNKPTLNSIFIAMAGGVCGVVLTLIYQFVI